MNSGEGHVVTFFWDIIMVIYQNCSIHVSGWVLEKVVNRSAATTQCIQCLHEILWTLDSPLREDPTTDQTQCLVVFVQLSPKRYVLIPDWSLVLLNIKDAIERAVFVPSLSPPLSPEVVERWGAPLRHHRLYVPKLWHIIYLWLYINDDHMCL